MKNIAASIQHKLKEIAKKEGKTYDLITLRYFQERLLYRLSISIYRDNFCLKGGAFIYAFSKEKSRPTKDIDFLGKNIANDETTLIAIFKEICQIKYPNDGVSFDFENITSEIITENKTYPGIKLGITAYFEVNKLKSPNISIDIGFGDFITPEPKDIEYPTFLEMDAPKIKAYSIETVIAEKFAAMIDLGESNSRMKDFYDVYKILSSPEYDKDILQEAISNTFNVRNTPYHADHPIFNDSFIHDDGRLKQWETFLKKSNLDTSIKFREVLDLIKEILKPMYDKL